MTAPTEPTPHPLGSWQLSLRMLFAITALAATLLACIREPIWLLTLPPLVVLGSVWMVTGTLFPCTYAGDTSSARVARWVLAFVPALFCFALPKAREPSTRSIALGAGVWWLFTATQLLDARLYWHRLAAFVLLTLACALGPLDRSADRPLGLVMCWVALPAIYFLAGLLPRTEGVEERPMPMLEIAAMWFCAALGAAPLPIALATGWRPENALGWVMYLALPLIAFTLAHAVERVSCLVLVLPLLFFAVLAMPVIDGVEHAWDVARGYEKLYRLPAPLVAPGRDTAILERYLGPAPFVWRHSRDLPRLFDWPYDFAELIEQVPEEERIHVLRIHTPGNCLMHHQVFFLRLAQFQPPPKEWWAKNRQAFEPETNPGLASCKVQNWADALRRWNGPSEPKARQIVREQYERLRRANEEIAKAWSPNPFTFPQAWSPDLSPW